MRKIPLHTRILFGLITGIVAGLIVRELVSDPGQLQTIVSWVKPVGDIFLRFIFMMIIPLILTALSLGVADLGDLGKLGRIGLRMLKYTLVVTSISVALGIGLTLLVRPGDDLSVADREYLYERFGSEVSSVAGNAEKAKEKTIGDILVTIIPKNPFEDMSRAFDPTYGGGGLLAVMFFALIFGVAMGRADQVKVAPVKNFLEGLNEIIMKVIGYSMKLAPYGVASLLFVLTVNLGFSILAVMLKYVLLVLFALALHLFVTYPIILKFFAGMNPAFFFRNIQDVMITAFSTSSSNATLPTAIKAAIEKLKLPKDISNFVLTIGSTANQNGTALYEGITILFLAQSFGVDLSITAQLMVVALSVLAGIGTAGVPGGSLPVIMLILVSIGVPGESIALIYGVDRILDMSRTVLNVTGDLTAAAYITKREQVRAEKLLA